MTGRGTEAELRSSGAPVRVDALYWRPEGRDEPVLDGTEFSVEAGERILLVGRSGAGKSTLLRAIAGVLASAEPGELRGSVVVDGREVTSGSEAVGLLLQDPGDATVAERAGRDTAFGLENLGVPRIEMAPLVRAALGRTRFPYDTDRSVRSLSGGETQRLALAGVLVFHPRLVLLDEPAAMLDPVTAAGVREAIIASTEETGATLIVVEHRLDPWLDRVDRAIVLGARGRAVRTGPPRAVLDPADPALGADGLWLPGVPPPVPLEVDVRWCAPGAPVESPVLLRASGVGYRHPRTAGQPRSAADEPPALTRVDAVVRGGRILAVTGPSGAGKSTLTALLAGLTLPDEGMVAAAAELGGPSTEPGRWPALTLAARVGWVPQNAEIAVVDRTVLAEVSRTSKELGRDEADTGARVRALLETLALHHAAESDPHQLSGGEMRRLALAAAVAHGPNLLVLDEPTVGQDRGTWAAVAGIVLAARAAGLGVVVATHDPDLIALADDRLHLAGGRAIVPGERAERTALPLPSGERAGRRALADRCGPLSLLASGILLLVGSGWILTPQAGLAGLLAELALAPAVVGVTDVPLRRLAPGALAVASIGVSTWLLGPGHSPIGGVVAALRIAFFVLPGLLLVASIDASALGDHLAQRLHLPSRPVVAAVAAWQRLDQLSELWVQIRAVRRVRGLSRSGLRGRFREFAATTFALLIQSLRQAGRMAVAMEARGFATEHALHRRTWAAPAPWRVADSVLVALALLVGAVPAVLSLLSAPR